jgi:pilus assembly protein CpaC
LTVAVTPAILGDTDDIQLDLKMNQINLTGRAPSGGPITSQHAIETKLYVKSNESAAIAGVNSQDTGTDFNKDDPNPGTFQGTTSPLFSMLHSKAFRKKKSQFVIFVTPQIVENASEGSEEMKKNFRVKVK